MISAINSAAGGLARAQAAAATAARGVSDAAAGDVASAAAALPGGEDLARQLVALKMSEVSYSASAEVIKAVDRMNEEMLNLLA